MNYFEANDDDLPSPKRPKKDKKKHHKSSKQKHNSNKDSAKALPNPFLMTDKHLSVFSTPFQKEQEAKKLALEKHVKLTDHSKDVLEINGKKICHSYRKGRCKFGSKCKFAHDSDLMVPIENPIPVDTDNSINAQYNLKAQGGPVEEENNSRKRKPGLKEGLVPVKKSREKYHQQQKQETPWLANRKK